jgi:LPS export ABC transporter protein LptC
MKTRFQNIFYLFLYVVLTFSCNDIKDVSEIPEYEGPILELTNIESFYSDSAIVRLKLVAPKQFEYENNDREFIDGIYLEFYEIDGSISSTLRANYCYHYGNEDKWRAFGNVIVKNMVDYEQLNTEELFWEPKKEIIYTDKFVRIETDGEIITGEGMEAPQDFSTWRLKNFHAVISLDE